MSDNPSLPPPGPGFAWDLVDGQDKELLDVFRSLRGVSPEAYKAFIRMADGLTKNEHDVTKARILLAAFTDALDVEKVPIIDDPDPTVN